MPYPDPGDGRQVEGAVRRGVTRPLGPIRHPYGDGRGGGASGRTAAVLATFDPRLHPLTKKNAY